MAWELTKGLTNLRNQLNTRFPHRDKTSDGTIGDPEHQSKTSGHNPDDTKGSKPAWDGDSDNKPEVRAMDTDDDLGEPDTTAQMLVDHMCGLPNLGSVIRYMIYGGKIYHVDDEFGSANYDGENQHWEHIHFEGARSDSADNNTTFNFRLDEVGDPMSAISDYFESAAKAVRGDSDATSADRAARDTLATVLRFGWGLTFSNQTSANLAPGRFNELEDKTDAILAAVTVPPTSD